MKPNTKTRTQPSKVVSKPGQQQSAQGNRKDQVSKTQNSKEALIKKLHLCMRNFDYKDESKDIKAKTDRLNAIAELQMMLQDQKNVAGLIIPNLDEVMQMIEKNIFRPLPNVKKNNLGFAETGIDQEEEMDPAWPHLQGIYEFFLQLVINESVEVRSLKVYVTPQFV